MGKRQINDSFVVVTLDEKGRVKTYLSPTHLDPEETLQHLIRARMQIRSEIVSVIHTVTEVLDEQGVIDEIKNKGNRHE